MFHSPREIRIRTPNKSEVSQIDNELYGCEFCPDGGWSSETEVEIHKTNKHKTELLQLFDKNEDMCGICYAAFKDNTELMKHIKTEHLYSSENAFRVEREIFVCNDCCQIFFNKLHLIIHVTQNHGDKNSRKQYVECPKCNLYIKCKCVWVHFHNHMIQSISSCRLCFNKCKNRRELKEHLKGHGHYFKCEICGYISKHANYFNSHIKDRHKNKTERSRGIKKIRRYFIPRNDIMIGRPQILMIFRGLRLGNMVKICILCREICVGKRQMHDHIRYDHNFSDKFVKNEYYCSCGEVFNNKVLIKHHIFKLKGNHSIDISILK